MKDLSPFPWRPNRNHRRGNWQIVSGQAAQPIGEIYSAADARLLSHAPEMVDLLTDLAEYHAPNTADGKRLREVLYAATLDECVLAELPVRVRLDIMGRRGPACLSGRDER